MLLRGVYTFEPRPEDHDHTLAFTCNDTLLFLEVLKRDPNWIKVADIYGRVGYIPKIFVEPDENCEDRNFILSFLADAVIKARQNGLHSAFSLELLRDEIRENPLLVQTRGQKMLRVFQPLKESPNVRRSRSDHNLKDFSRHGAPAKLSASRCSESSIDFGRRTDQSRAAEHLHGRGSSNRQDHVIPQRQGAQEDGGYVSDASVKTVVQEEAIVLGQSREIKHENERKQKRPVTSPSFERIKESLVNVIQEKSGLDRKISENLLHEVFQRIKQTSSTLPVESFLEKMNSSTMTLDEYEDGPSHELTRLMKFLSKLSKECIKSVGQKKKAPIPTKADLDKLRKLLIECDTLQVTRKLVCDQHKFSQDLVHLYHLESPESIKESILDIFGIICSLDKTGRAALLSSKLPINLARELMATISGTKIYHQILVLLTSLLSCGEVMPGTHFQILGSGFTNYLVREEEDAFSKSCESEYDRIAPPFKELFKLLLAYNLQFQKDSEENFVLKVLAERWKRPKGFITVLLELFKKGRDPLFAEHEYNSEKLLPHSVFKMVRDICSCQQTVTHLTHEDKHALVNCTIEGILENPAGSTRMGYLMVLGSLLGSVDRSLDEIRMALVGILLDTDPLAVPEHHLVRQMSKEHKQLFPRSVSRIRANVGGYPEIEDCSNMS